MERKQWNFITVLCVSAIVLASIIIFYPNRKRIFPSVENHNQVKIENSHLPKMAYLDTFGIRTEKNKPATAGDLVVMDIREKNKQVIFHFDTKDFQQANIEMVYSFLTRELIVTTDAGIEGINMVGKERNIYPSLVRNISISDDGEWLYFSQSGKDMKINIQTLTASPLDDCERRLQPYYNTNTKLAVEIKAKDFYTSPTGIPFGGMKHAISSTIKVCTQKGDKIYTFRHPKDDYGSLDPLVLTDKYLYFKILRCCTDDSQAVHKIFRLNLGNGEIADWSTLAETNGLIPVDKNVGEYDIFTLGMKNKGKSLLLMDRIKNTYYWYSVDDNELRNISRVESTREWKETDRIEFGWNGNGNLSVFNLTNNQIWIKKDWYQYMVVPLEVD